MAGKLTQIIIEKVEKIKTEDIFTDLTNNTDKDVIDEFVNAKGKNDRIAIAANPNLTLEQQTKLANDKTNGVKQALCYNSNLDLELAKELIKEEPKWLEFIAEYGNSHLDDLVLDNLPVGDGGYEDSIYLARMLRSPELKDSTIEKMIELDYDGLKSTDSRVFFRKQNLSKDIVWKLFNHLVKEKSYSDKALQRLIVNQKKHISEADIKKMDWKNNSDIKGAIFYRDDISEKLIIDALNTIGTGGKEIHDSTNALGDSKNPNILSSAVLNAYLEALLRVEDPTSYVYEWNVFEKAKRIPLDPRLLIDVVKKVQNGREPDHYGIKHLVSNINFPEYGIDEINPTKDLLTGIGSNKNISQKKIEELIERFANNKAELEKLMWGLAANKETQLSEKHQMIFLDSEIQNSYSIEYIIRGEFADKVISNLKDYTYLVQSEWTEPAHEKSQLIRNLAKNGALTSKQRKNLLDEFDKLGVDEKKSYETRETLEDEMITQKNNDVSFMMELVEKNPTIIWKVWTMSGSTYFQFGKLQDDIDKIALSNASKDVPFKVLEGNVGTKNFSAWVKYNNNGLKYNWPDSRDMSDTLAKKYLLKFIKDGDDTMKEKLPKFIDAPWLEDADVLSAMYEMTGDESYLPQEAKDIFLF